MTGVDSARALADLTSWTGAYEKVVAADAAALPFADRTFDWWWRLCRYRTWTTQPGPSKRAREYSPRVAASSRPSFIRLRRRVLGREPAEQRGYFDVQRTVDATDRGGIAFTFHQVHAWTALFFDAGFVLEALREPRPSEQDALTHPGLAETRARPAFRHVRCYQPEEGTTG